MSFTFLGTKYINVESRNQYVPINTNTYLST